MSIKTKQKSNKQPKKKNQSPNLLKNENHVQLNKTKQNNYHTHNPGNQKKKKKKKKKEKERNWTNCPYASVHPHFCPLNNLIFSLQFS